MENYHEWFLGESEGAIPLTLLAKRISGCINCGRKYLDASVKRLVQ